MQLLLSFCLVLLTSVTAAGSTDRVPEQVAEFLATRQLLVTVAFAPGSSLLTPEARAEIDRNLDRLRNIDGEKYVLRIEGFTSPEGGVEQNVNLAMERARQVEIYLLKQEGLTTERTLTGIGVDTSSRLSPQDQRRVEIARYDNILQFDKLPREKLILH